MPQYELESCSIDCIALEPGIPERYRLLERIKLRFTREGVVFPFVKLAYSLPASIHLVYRV